MLLHFIPFIVCFVHVVSFNCMFVTLFSFWFISFPFISFYFILFHVISFFFTFSHFFSSRKKMRRMTTTNNDRRKQTWNCRNKRAPPRSEPPRHQAMPLASTKGLGWKQITGTVYRKNMSSVSVITLSVNCLKVWSKSLFGHAQVTVVGFTPFWDSGFQGSFVWNKVELWIVGCLRQKTELGISSWSCQQSGTFFVTQINHWITHWLHSAWHICATAEPKVHVYSWDSASACLWPVNWWSPCLRTRGSLATISGFALCRKETHGNGDQSCSGFCDGPANAPI